VSALGNLREATARVLRRPAEYFKGEWERMAPRVRVRVIALSVGVAVALLLLVATWSFTDIADLRDENASIREALTAIAKHRDEYLDAKAKNAVAEARIGTEPPQLTADLEAAARGENVQISESSERPAAPAGKRYVQHDVDIKVREVELMSLTKFMRRVETGPRMVFFTRLSLKHRYSEANKLDAELTASAFERVREDKTKKKPEGANQR
jgi:hypothetical protein